MSCCGEAVGSERCQARAKMQPDSSTAVVKACSSWRDLETGSDSS